MVIDMKMGEGRGISIHAHQFLERRSCSVKAVRLVAKLAAASDLIYGTDCVKTWSCVIYELIGQCEMRMKRLDTEQQQAFERGDIQTWKESVAEFKKADTQRRKYLKYEELFANAKP